MQNLKISRRNSLFLREISGRNSRDSEKTWSLLGKILKFQGETQVFPGENIGFPGEIFHYFSQKNAISP